MGTAYAASAPRQDSERSGHVDLRRRASSLTARKIRERVAGAVLVCGITYGAFQLHLTVPAIACAYLLMVVLAALRWGVWEATATTVAAFLFLDYFFMEPLFSLRVDGSANWIALGAFEFVGLVVSNLSARALRQAQIATEERNNATRLYELSRCVLQLDRREPPGHQIAVLVQRAIGVDSVALYDPSVSQTDEAGAANPAIRDLARDAWVQDENSGGSENNAWARVLRIGGKSIGAIAMCGKDLNPLVADVTASIAAITLERSRTLENETRAEAARQSDRLRTAVLDSLAHAFKTPLTAIRAASSGLLETGDLQSPEAELVSLIDDEAEHLADLANRLLQTARLEKEDVIIRNEEFRISDLIEDLLERLPAGFENDRVNLDIRCEHTRMRGNSELIVIALLQLVDNAFKYSTPGSPISVAATFDAREVIISVRNQGPAIRPEERQRIFERFYRAPGTQNLAPGTGLGLSITRKVAEAHQGRTWVLCDEDSGTTFFLALPASQGNIT